MVLAVIGVLGCQRLPPRGVGEAEAARAAAWAACAPEYAPEAFAAARGELEGVEHLLSHGHRRRAGRLATRATRSAQEAIVAARRSLTAHRAGAEESIRRAEQAMAKADASRGGRSPGEEFGVARRRLSDARVAASVGTCNYVRARDLANEAKLLVQDSEAPAIARLPAPGGAR